MGREDLVLGGVDLKPENDPTHPPATGTPDPHYGIRFPGHPEHGLYVARLREAQRERPEEVHPCPPPANPRRPTPEEVAEHARTHTRNRREP